MKPVIIDMGCSSAKIDGALGFDRVAQPGVNVVCDFERQLPIRTSSVDGVHLSHIIEHIRNLIPFMEEVCRVCKAGAEVRVVAPYYTSRGAFRDPTHVRFIAEDTFQYFEPPTIRGPEKHFRIERIEYDYRKPFRFFPRYVQKRCRRYLWNVVDNLTVILRVVNN